MVTVAHPCWVEGTCNSMIRTHAWPSRGIHAALRPQAVNAEQLITAIAGLPVVRKLGATAPVQASVLVAGIEVATTGVTADGSLRRAWRDRQRGGPDPLLLVADHASKPGALLALGVTDPAGPLREVDAEALAKVLIRISSQNRLEATRELASELERLDQAGLPGLKLRDLLTMHTLTHRVRRNPARWQPAVAAVQGIVRTADWRGVLTGLGYMVERLPLRGYLLRHEGRPVALVHPKADPADFARLGADGRPPEGLLVNDCVAAGVRYGLLVSGGRLRLFDAEAAAGAAVARYIDLDNELLQQDHRPLLYLLGPQYLGDGLFEELSREAQVFGSDLRKRLDLTIRQSVFPALGRALASWARSQQLDLADDGVRTELERASLTLLFRLLFILYAESSGYLPMGNRSYSQASLSALVTEAAETKERLGERSTSLWDRLGLLVRALRSGNPAWSVPAYNGALFAPSSFDGAATLEQLSIQDPAFATILLGIGRDAETGTGVDYSTLEISNLGHIYEGLLSLRLTQAPTALIYDARRDTYRHPSGTEAPDHQQGELVWMTNEGGRKGGGVYYTRSELVRHLVKNAVVPAFQAHLDTVRHTAQTDPVAASLHLFDFAVVDPACGSAHFLVELLDQLADMSVRFLAETPLPALTESIARLRAGATPGMPIDDVALIRRLVLKRCVYGVDVSAMGAEVAKVSLWLASFVPGLSLAYLDRNVIVGNSLLGVADPEAVRIEGKRGQLTWGTMMFGAALQEAAAAVALMAASEDRTPDEVDASHAADTAAHVAAAGLERLFDLWTADLFGLEGARHELEWNAQAVVDGPTILSEIAARTAREHAFLHWPVAFPSVFARANAGFDSVVGNPPWNEVTVERLAFLAPFSPGLRGLPEEERRKAAESLVADRPELLVLLQASQERARRERAYLAAGEFTRMPGDPDLYKFFCQRYGALLRQGGTLGVVLPRSAFIANGSAAFREWLFEQNTCLRLDFLLNTGRWAFDSEPRYTVALAAARREKPSPDHRMRTAGIASSLDQWQVQAASEGVALALSALGPGRAVPLLRSQAEADLLALLRTGSPFPFGAGARWKCFAVAELHETNDQPLWRAATAGRQLWKGESFDQFNPHGAESRWCPESDAVWRKVRKPRPGADSLVASKSTLQARREAVLREVNRARVAFRDVSRATDSRTVRACLVPPGVFLTNKAPYLAFVEGGPVEQAACLAVMNSLAFDWQARRFVETNLNFFILEGLYVPNLSNDHFIAIANAACRLSCADDRFDDFARETGIERKPLGDPERERLKIEIDARVAKSWGLTAEDLSLILADFTLDAVPAVYRQQLLTRFGEI